ncbi:MAG: YggS family pyridoxal phosphate-dependent enzyme [Flavobacteriales bacterium]|jgi:pyridoxal phosphate enzyme (YggS family)
MASITENLAALNQEIPSGVLLIAVSKTKPVALLEEAYSAGQRAFGENYVQELTEKQPQLPSDIDWHFIGHLQSNKVKYIAPFVHCIHGVDSFKLLNEISKQAIKQHRTIRCLLQVHIASEETKFGFSPDELLTAAESFQPLEYPGVAITGLMGMASFTDDESQIRTEFKSLKTLFDKLKAGAFHPIASFTELSMGMSSDWKIAVQEGSTMIRVGSSIFGSRN